MAAQRDVQLQKGWLQETLEASNQEVAFYPKFHCEWNFIEHFWCGAKWYTHETANIHLKGSGKRYHSRFIQFLLPLSTVISTGV
jgi:hypothetical protein